MTENRFASVVSGQKLPNYIVPLFWQHGEPFDVLTEEIDAMHRAGIGAFIVESRPFPDYLGEHWWATLQHLLNEAKLRGMKMWVFDDSSFPSGFAGGTIRDKYPQYMKIYLRENHIDAAGPAKGAAFRVSSWLWDAADTLVRAIAVRRTDGVDAFDPTSAVDITSRVVDGRLYWDVPDGFWRVFLFFRTRQGGEEGVRDYLNPLDPEPVQAYIAEVHEQHYRRFADDFGQTFAGFFTDEPRFGNLPIYEGVLGNKAFMPPFRDSTPVLPFSDRLIDRLSQAWGSDFSLMLPALWYDGGELGASARFTYMDVVSRLFGENLLGQIGEWCRAHHVELIGHIVEDNGAHTRTGYGPGHFFRALRGQDTSGIDIVYQVWPEYTDGRMSSPFGYLDVDFEYWGLGKLGSSEGHIDPKKRGRTVCELFGAYGWEAGLKLMKWLTDHACVRGINILIPHAFSPKDFPDPDCPPHFYGRGHNPQWRYFSTWSAYAQRVCHLLSDGDHVAPVAVVYHAEAEWAGACEPFQKAVKTLLKQQIDCDVVPVDTLIDAKASVATNGALKINRESYRAIVVPYAEACPAAMLQRLLVFAENGMRVIFMNALPTRIADRQSAGLDALEKLASHPGVVVTQHTGLVALLHEWRFADIRVSSPSESLRYYHYVHGAHVYFFVNEAKATTVRTTVTFAHATTPIGYDALTHTTLALSAKSANGTTSVDLVLEPYESLFVVFDATALPKPTATYRDRTNAKTLATIDGKWTILTATAETYPTFTPQPTISTLTNLAVPTLLPKFSGTVRYEIEFDFAASQNDAGGTLDLGEVYEVAEATLNDQPLGVRICPPYRLDATAAIRSGKNRLCIDVTNTLGKALGDNWLDRHRPQEPTGLLGPIRLTTPA